MIMRWSFLIDQPSPTKRAARKSRSSGFVGGADWLPRSSGVETNPVPKCCCQTRFTRTRAVIGFVGLAIARARSRRPLPFLKGIGCLGSGESIDRKWRVVSGPLFWASPRRSTG
jgi:hypothetical protein